MNYTEIKFTKRIVTGQYEHEELTVSALIGENDNAEAEVANLKAFVSNSLYGKTVVKETVTKKAVTPAVEKKEVVAEIKKEEAPIVEEPTKELTKAVVEEKTIVKEGETKNGKEKDSKKSDKKITTKKEVVDKKTTPYDRSSDIHKKLLIGMLSEKVGSVWQNNAAKVKESSIKFSGKPFLNDKGVVLETFVTDFLADCGLA